MTENFPGPMAGKTALVTGGTGGIGRATAAGLAALGARVGITGRDKARTQAAATGIVRESGNPAVDAFAADMSCQAGVRALAVAVCSAYPRLDVLASNVGGFWATRHLTADGLERTFAVNHLAAFLLTGLVLDRLKGSAPAWIVTVSSGVHATGTLNFGDLQGEHSYSGQQAYSQSRLASVVFTHELACRLEDTGVTATVLHRGLVRTACAAEDPSRLSKVMIPLLRPFMKALAKALPRKAMAGQLINDMLAGPPGAIPRAGPARRRGFHRGPVVGCWLTRAPSASASLPAVAPKAAAVRGELDRAVRRINATLATVGRLLQRLTRAAAGNAGFPAATRAARGPGV